MLRLPVSYPMASRSDFQPIAIQVGAATGPAWQLDPRDVVLDVPLAVSARPRIANPTSSATVASKPNRPWQFKPSLFGRCEAAVFHQAADKTTVKSRNADHGAVVRVPVDPNQRIHVAGRDLAQVRARLRDGPAAAPGQALPRQPPDRPSSLLSVGIFFAGAIGAFKTEHGHSRPHLDG